MRKNLITKLLTQRLWELIPFRWAFSPTVVDTWFTDSDFLSILLRPNPLRQIAPFWINLIP